VRTVFNANGPKLALSYFTLASAAILLTRLNGGIALLWLANAPLIAHLCATRPARWRAALLWTVPASVAASSLFGPVLWASPFLGIASILEAVLAAVLLRRLPFGGNRFDSSASVVMFSVVAGLVAPMISGLLGASIAWVAFGRPWGATYLDWVVGHGLGTVIASPVVALLSGRGRGRGVAGLLTGLWSEGGALLLAVFVVTAVVFLQHDLPLLFMPALPILIATFKLGRRGAALSIAIVALIGWVATANGFGPIMMTSLSQAGQFQFFQFYLAATFLMSLPVAGALEQREKLLLALETSEARHRRIVGRSQDVIFETDADGRWTFLSDAWVRLTGQDSQSSLGEYASHWVLEGDRAKLDAASYEARERSGDLGQIEVRFRGSEGVRWAAVNLGILRDAEGRVIGSYGTIRDVTQRKLNEAETVRSQRRYQLLADNTSDMIARIGLDGIFRSVTPACLPLLGRSPGELVGTRCMDLILPEYVPEVVAAYTALLEGGTDQTCSYRHFRRDADPMWVESVIRLIRDDEGKPHEFIVSVRDISQRKLLESEAAAVSQRLRESHRLSSMAGALASIGHWRFEVGGDSVIWSDEVFRIHGLPVGAPPPLADAMEFYHPDDRARVQALLAEAIAEKRGFGWEARVVRPNGCVRHVVTQGQVELDETGRMIAMFGVFQDVTERALADATLRDSEARLRFVTEQASDIIALIDLDGVCLFMSPASDAILGSPAAALIGTRPVERVHEADRAIVEDYRVGLHAGTGTSVSSVRFRMRRSDGDYAWLEASSRLAEINEKPCVVSVWRDVSRQVAVEAALNAAKTEAEAGAAAKAGFLANMSHEIRTPMNGVIGFAELLLAGELSAEQRRNASLIADSGKAMMKLLNDILDLSKIEAGQLETVSEPFDLPHAVRACGKLLGASAAQKQLELRVDIPDEVPRFILGDGLRVRQIVLNLVGNAIKFTERGSVTLAMRQVQQNGEPWIAIIVRDTGIGIAPERQGSIFEEFVQADHSITRRYGGTGLGLAISNRLAMLMGGRIELESAVGQGTAVTLLIPATPTAAPAVSAAIEAPAVQPVRRPSRILLAEDHEVNQLLVHAMLTQGGHEVVLVENGEEALEAVRDSFDRGVSFDLVLMDMQMPIMDGLTATRAIREMEKPTGRRVPIVALTANAFASDLESCSAAGMDGHVAKPVSMEALLAAVDRWSDAPAVVLETPVRRKAGIKPSAAAQTKYAEHRARTLEHVDALIRRGTFSDDEIGTAAELLHKLAGTAGMFGEAELGDHASELEEGLLAWPASERATRIPATAALLREAA
jgi:PAS domain S-box-containing protein